MTCEACSAEIEPGSQIYRIQEGTVIFKDEVDMTQMASFCHCYMCVACHDKILHDPG